MHFLIPNLNTLYYKICVAIQKAFLNSLVPVKGRCLGGSFSVYILSDYCAILRSMTSSQKKPLSVTFVPSPRRPGARENTQEYFGTEYS